MSYFVKKKKIMKISINFWKLLPKEQNNMYKNVHTCDVCVKKKDKLIIKNC